MSDIFENLKQAKILIEEVQGPSINLGFVSHFNSGVPIFETELLIETEEYEEVIQLSFWQRWIEPFSTFIKFQTMPFEPWAKFRIVTKIRQIPSRKILQTQFGLIMHPALNFKIKQVLNGEKYEN